MIGEKQNPWDAIADMYDSQFGDEGDYSHKYVIYPSIINHLEDIEDKVILDLGCGTGTLSRILAKKKARVIGTDSSEEMIKIARRRENNYKYPIQYHILDAAKPLAKSKNSFDYVLIIMLLHSINDQKVDKVIQQSHSMLKAEGECYIAIPHPFYIKEFRSIGHPAYERYLTNYKTYFVWKQFNEICQSPTHFYLRPLEFYSKIFEQYGFLIKSIFEPKIIDSIAAKDEKPNIYNRRKEIPGFMIIKLVKSKL